MNDLFAKLDKISMLEVLADPFGWGKITVESRELIKRAGLVVAIGHMSSDNVYMYLVRYKGDKNKGKRPDDWGFISETVREARVDGHFQRETMSYSIERCLQHELGLENNQIPQLLVDRGPFFFDSRFQDVGEKPSFARTCVFWVDDPSSLPVGNIESPEIAEAQFYPANSILRGVNPRQLRETPSTLDIMRELNDRGFLARPGEIPIRWFNPKT